MEYTSGSRKSAVLNEFRQFYMQVEREIERLGGDAEELLLDDLMEGRFDHPDVAFNQSVMAQLDSYAIRSDGFIESLTGEQLREHYQKALNGTSSATAASVLNLKLRLEDFAPAEILEELELAPDTMELEAKRGTNIYPVDYQYEEIDGERVAVGVVTVPVAVYERNCAEVGHRSKFPELPYNIQLIIEVTENDKLLARGKQDDMLRSQVKKRKGKGGNKRADEANRIARLSALDIRVEGPTAPPPWHKGRAR